MTPCDPACEPGLDKAYGRCCESGYFYIGRSKLRGLASGAEVAVAVLYRDTLDGAAADGA